MNAERNWFTVITYAVAFVIATVLWRADLYLGAIITLLIGGGLAMARPTLEDQRVVLRGTPIVLMFAVMLTSASGMVYAVDQVSALWAPAPEPVEECMTQAGAPVVTVTATTF